MVRPALTDKLTAEEFAAWYWLKEELVEFCRAHRISPSGAKRQIEARVVDFLSGRKVGEEARKRIAVPRPAGRIPETFSMDMAIGEGWRCGPMLGAFLRNNLGSTFRFNAAVREFIHTGAGKRLGDVEFCWLASLGKVREIPEQLEYNRHFRRYFREHPGATRAEAIAAWWELRASRKA